MMHSSSHLRTRRSATGRLICGRTRDARLIALIGFARSAPIERRLMALSSRQRAALRTGGAVRLGARPWDDRLHLVAFGARTPNDRRGPWVYVTSLRSIRPRILAAP